MSAEKQDSTEKTLAILKLVLVALCASIMGGFSAGAYLNKNYVSAASFEKLQREVDDHEEEDRKLNQEIRLKYVEANQIWVGNTLMAIAYKVGVEVGPPPLLSSGTKFPDNR